MPGPVMKIGISNLEISDASLDAKKKIINLITFIWLKFKDM